MQRNRGISSSRRCTRSTPRRPSAAWSSSSRAMQAAARALGPCRRPARRRHAAPAAEGRRRPRRRRRGDGQQRAHRRPDPRATAPTRSTTRSHDGSFFDMQTFTQALIELVVAGRSTRRWRRTPRRTGTTSSSASSALDKTTRPRSAPPSRRPRSRTFPSSASLDRPPDARSRSTPRAGVADAEQEWPLASSGSAPPSHARTATRWSSSSSSW